MSMRDSYKEFRVISLESNEEFILGETLEEDASFQNQSNVCEDINSSTNKEDVDDKTTSPYFKYESNDEFNERKIVYTKKERSGYDSIVKKKLDDNEKEKSVSMIPTIQLVPYIKSEEKYSDLLNCLDDDAINNLADSHHTVLLEGVQLHSNKNNQEGNHPSQKANPLPIEIDDDETNSLKQNKIQNPVNNSPVQQPQGVKSKKASHSTPLPASFVRTITDAIFKSADKKLHVASLLTCLPITQHSQAIKFLSQSRRFISLPGGWWTLHPAVTTRMAGEQTHTEGKNKKADPLPIEIDDDETNSLKQNKIQNPVNNSPVQQPQGVKSKKASHSTTLPASFVRTITDAIFKSADKKLHVASLLTCLPITQHSLAIKFLNQSRRFISLPRGWWTLHPAVTTRMAGEQTHTEGKNKIGEKKEVVKSVIDSPAGFKNPSSPNQVENPKSPLPSSCSKLNCTKWPTSVINTANSPATHCVKNVSTNAATSEVEDLSDVDCNRSQECNTPGPGLNRTKKYICQQCGKSFEFKSRLIRHLNNVHVKTREYLCSICCEAAQCSKSYSSEASLMLHIKLAHSNNNERQQCTKCGKYYKNVISLRVHIRTVHTMNNKFSGPVSCYICNKSFVNKEVMKRHKIQVHKVGIVKEFTCNDCLKTFHFKDDLIRHLKLTHMEPELTCDQCPKKFPVKERLQRHMRVEHGIENRRTFICDSCGKSFKEKLSLENHLLVHLGLKPWICSVCGKNFRTDSGLGQHSRTHSDERRFTCHLCDKAFRIKHHLRQHMAVHGLTSTPDYRKRRRCPSSTSSSDE